MVLDCLGGLAILAGTVGASFPPGMRASSELGQAQMTKGKGSGTRGSGAGGKGRKPNLRLVGPGDGMPAGDGLGTETGPETEGQAGPADPPSHGTGAPGQSDLVPGQGEEDDGTHYGEVIGPERVRPTRGPIIPSLGVTMKEEGYCRGVVSGLSSVAAYRASHDASGMTVPSQWAQAVKVGARDRVRARIETLLSQEAGNALHDRRRALAWALNRLQEEAETAETDGARVAAVSLIMRHHALLTDKLEAEVETPKDAKAIETALRDRLTRLLNRAG